jgi:hypothetical protein
MANKVDVFKSVPQEGAIERDWTDSNTVLVLDMVNGMSETFHFEVSATSKEIRGSGSDAPWGTSPMIIHNVFIQEPPAAVLDTYQKLQKRRFLQAQKKGG